MLPNFYNNFKRIVQTDEHVMILTGMNHDARIVRIGGTHQPDDVRSWFGDSIGHWEGDTLVVETTHFRDTPAMWRADENLKVTERFRGWMTAICCISLKLKTQRRGLSPGQGNTLGEQTPKAACMRWLVTKGTMRCVT